MISDESNCPVSVFQELSKERQKCLETLLYIAEIEEYYQVRKSYVIMKMSAVIIYHFYSNNNNEKTRTIRIMIMY